MNGKYVGYVAGEDPLHGFLSMIMCDRLGVREPRPAFRVFRLSGSNEVYAYEEKFSRVKIICKFYGTRFGTDLDKADWMARQEYDCLKTLRRYDLVGSPHHVIRPLARTRALLHGAEPAADRAQRLHRPGLRQQARDPGEEAAAAA